MPELPVRHGHAEALLGAERGLVEVDRLRGAVDVTLTTRIGSMTLAKTARRFLNGLFGLSLRRDPTWLYLLGEPLVFFLGLFGYFGAGQDLQVVCRKPA